MSLLSSVFYFCVSQAAKKLTSATGRHCLPLQMDVRQPDTISSAVDEALKEFGRVDILINSTSSCNTRMPL